MRIDSASCGGAGRPSEVARFRAHVLAMLEEKPDLLSVEVLRRLREVAYEGGKSAAYDFVAMLRSPKAPPLVRFEGLAGESAAEVGVGEQQKADRRERRAAYQQEDRPAATA